MRIDVVAPTELSTTDLAAWRALQVERDLKTPYLSPDWMLAPRPRRAGPTPVAAAWPCCAKAANWVGVFPARVGPFTAMPPGAPLCDYQGVVARPGVELSARALARAFGVQRIDLCNLVADQPGVRAPRARDGREPVRRSHRGLRRLRRAAQGGGRGGVGRRREEEAQAGARASARAVRGERAGCGRLRAAVGMEALAVSSDPADRHLRRRLARAAAARPLRPAGGRLRRAPVHPASRAIR